MLRARLPRSHAIVIGPGLGRTYGFDGVFAAAVAWAIENAVP